MPRKRYLPLLLAGLVALSACAAPAEKSPSPPPETAATAWPTAPPTESSIASELPQVLWPVIDDTHDAFTVPTGGRLGTVLVTVECRERESETAAADEWDWLFESEMTLSVWSGEDFSTPVQTMTKRLEKNVFGSHNVVDANFDGYPDFGCEYFRGNQPTYWYYWIWDERQGLFVEEPAFSVDETGEAVGGICMPSFDAEAEIISGWARSSCCSGIETYHRWEEGELVCFREVEYTYPDKDFNQEKVVYERIDGELVEVSREPYEMRG